MIDGESQLIPDNSDGGERSGDFRITKARGKELAYGKLPNANMQVLQKVRVYKP